MKVFIFRPAVTIISILSNIQLHIIEYTLNYVCDTFANTFAMDVGRIYLI